MPDAVDTVICAPDDGWKYHPKHVEQFPDINKLCNVASCWIYEYTGILLGVHYILHISRIRVNKNCALVVHIHNLISVSLHTQYCLTSTTVYCDLLHTADYDSVSTSQ